MKYRPLFLLAACSAIITGVFAAWRRPYRLLFHLMLAAFGLTASAQNWSSFLDSSRAIDWTQAGFTIPNYTANCATQPILTASSSSAAASNSTSIQNALASCDATHNVVNIPAGTYYINGITFGTQGHQVLRGAGPTQTKLIGLSRANCEGQQAGICMIDSDARYNGSVEVSAPSGTQQCSWSGGYAKGSTTITVSNCPGGPPPVNQTLILDQQNDTSDTGGVYVCDDTTSNCAIENPGANTGRVINGVTHSEQQVTYVTGVTSAGSGSYSVTISPAVYFNNIRSSQTPGAWWPGMVQNDGLEDLTIDGSSLPYDSSFGNIAWYDCYQCWIKNITSLYGSRNHVEVFQSADGVIRDSYFYQGLEHAQTAYGIEFEESSDVLVENNILQQLTAPFMFGMGSGNVIGYNFDIGSIYTGATGWMSAPFSSHNAGNTFNLWEGNNFNGIWTDIVHGSSPNLTYFRNSVTGWQGGYTNGLNTPVAIRSYERAYNIVGNILGQPSFSSTYEAYATSSTGGTNAGTAPTSVYELGWSDNSGLGVCTTPPACDPLVRSTLMRWGNYDAVNGAVQWNATEASPAAVPYVNANFTSSYFSSLAHSLPASLYYSSTPSWWPSGKNWPPTGPDVSTGNVGTCSGGSYPGAQATSSSTCGGGALSTAWASHVTSIPAQDCYWSIGGPADGSGAQLNFDANACYTSSGSSTSGSGPGSPTGLTAVVQ